MKVKTNIDWVQMSDMAIVRQLGSYIRQLRLQQNKTQAQLAEMAGLNRWTIGQIENGEAISLISLIQILRALDSLYVLNEFQVSEEISPLEYAKLKKKQKQRVKNKAKSETENNDMGW
jgi:transcriptional regulator with XRE-family HTH domain